MQLAEAAEVCEAQDISQTMAGDDNEMLKLSRVARDCDGREKGEEFRALILISQLFYHFHSLNLQSHNLSAEKATEDLTNN